MTKRCNLHKAILVLIGLLFGTMLFAQSATITVVNHFDLSPIHDWDGAEIHSLHCDTDDWLGNHLIHKTHLKIAPGSQTSALKMAFYPSIFHYNAKCTMKVWLHKINTPPSLPGYPTYTISATISNVSNHSKLKIELSPNLSASLAKID